ncbi:hypothetical protein BDZ89DRAFT_1017295 [Hymenopellis radicata]|nr:hypothetical protein BDZ89DRAFT_1017295 [Hymenopellis radicata]
MAPSYVQFSNKEKTDMRRIRGQLSCAECRRLKLKCDKQIPCGSCLRRGCDSICPTGTLANGTGKKLVVSDTSDLHHKVEEMGERIKALEQAIEQFQSTISTDTHSLLRPELLNIKFPPGLSLPTEKQEQPTLELADALGTLTINENGSTKYFGSTAGTETLFLAGAEIQHQSFVDNESFKSIPVSRLQTGFPIGEGSTWDVAKSLPLLYAFLPPKPRAWTLCETYLQNGAWSGNVVTRSEIVDDILAPIYKRVELHTEASEAETPVMHHKLATLFLVFALGTLLDLTAPPYSPEADNYFDLGVSALNLHPLFSSPETGTVQALLLMAVYLSLGGRRFTMEGAWSMVALASKLGQSIGLHRESAQWKLDPKILDRRRKLFWELYTYDVSLSVKLGRPPSIRLSYVDVPLPIDDEQSLDEDGTIVPGYHWLKWNFAKTLISKVAEVTLSAKPLPYSAILDLDRILREGKPYKKYRIGKSWEGSPLPNKFFRPFLLKQHRAVTGMYIHRSYFAQAVLTHPSDPLLSPYAASYLAAYRCASGLISIKVKYFTRFPELLIRWWSIWSSFFSASIIVGTVAIHTRDSHLAARAFAELCLAVELFEKGSISSTRARHGLVILQRLRDRAVTFFSQQDAEQVVGYSAKPRIDTSDFDDELEIFGGQTRVVVSRLLARRPMPSPAPPQPVPMMLENNQQSLVDFFASQMGPDWTTPHPNDTLPIPQPQYNYGAGGLPTDTPLFSGKLNEDHSFANDLSFDSNMSTDVNDGSSSDTFLRLLDQFSSRYVGFPDAGH